MRWCPMDDRFQAVVGYTMDAECATWGAGATAHAALLDACQQFYAELADEIEPGDYEATVYDTPVEREQDGDIRVVAWLDRGLATLTVGADGRYAVCSITWTDGEVSHG